MNLSELNEEQKLQLKESILAERDNNISLGELFLADDLVTDEELEKRYGSVYFVEEDFFYFIEEDK